jgi:hypothetical protein
MNCTSDIQYIHVRNWSETVVSVYQFNGGNSHIVVHRDCWAVVSSGILLEHIFADALEILKTLPNRPLEYKPYKIFKDGLPLRVV